MDIKKLLGIKRIEYKVLWDDESQQRLEYDYFFLDPKIWGYADDSMSFRIFYMRNSLDVYEIKTPQGTNLGVEKVIKCVQKRRLSSLASYIFQLAESHISETWRA